MNRKERRIIEAQGKKNAPPDLLKQAAVLHLAGNTEAAEALYRHILKADASNVNALTLLGAAVLDRGKYEEALELLDKALALQPHHIHALNHRSAALIFLNRPAEALQSYDQEIALNPNDNGLYYRKGMAALTLGDFESGWKLYERRRLLPEFSFSATSDKPLWLGQELIAGKTLFLHAEQGQGDTLQFCRYVPLIEKLGAQVVLGISSSLISVVASLKGNYQLLGEGTFVCNHDVQCPLMSLPLAMGTRLDTIPADIPYLYADTKKTAGVAAKARGKNPAAHWPRLVGRHRA